MACDYLSAREKSYLFFDFDHDRDFLEEAKEFYSLQTVPIIIQNNALTGEVKLLGGYTDLLKYDQDFA